MRDGRFSFDAFYQQLVERLPPHPVAPENRGFARLLPSPWVDRGRMYRMLGVNLEALDRSDPVWRTLHLDRPLIVMHLDDVIALRAAWGALGRFVNVDQEIADIAEQLFALQEAQALDR